MTTHTTLDDKFPHMRRSRSVPLMITLLSALAFPACADGPKEPVQAERQYKNCKDQDEKDQSPCYDEKGNLVTRHATTQGGKTFFIMRPYVAPSHAAPSYRSGSGYSGSGHSGAYKGGVSRGGFGSIGAGRGAFS